MKDGRPVLMKTAELGSLDDREVKVQNIGLQIGRRPILAYGNSDGDLAMLRYVKSGYGARLALLLHHDDAEREAAYDREFMVSPLAEALDKASRVRHHGRQREAGLEGGVWLIPRREWRASRCDLKELIMADQGTQPHRFEVRPTSDSHSGGSAPA